MALRFARADPAAVVTHRQARGYATMHVALCAAFPNVRDVRFCSADRETRFTCSVLRLSDLTVCRTAMSGCQFRVEPSDVVRVALPISGVVAVTSRRRESVAIPGVAGVVCAHEVSIRDAPTEHAGFMFKIAQDRLLAHARTLTEEQFSIDDMATSIDLRDPVGATLFRSVAALFGEVENLATVGLEQLACSTANDLIVNLAAAAILPSLRDRIALPQRWVGGSTVEGARQFIDAHAAEPIHLGDLANRLGVSLRALQAGFRKQFGCTLSDYLFKRRLDLARARLLSRNRHDTVTAVALECGFVNVGAFADRYRRAFGELPSQTLRGIACGLSRPRAHQGGQLLIDVRRDGWR